MCSNGSLWRRAADERGQTTAEYVTLLGAVTAIAVIMSNMLGFSLRQVLSSVAQRMISVITGY